MKKWKVYKICINRALKWYWVHQQIIDDVLQCMQSKKVTLSSQFKRHLARFRPKVIIASSAVCLCVRLPVTACLPCYWPLYRPENCVHFIHVYRPLCRPWNRTRWCISYTICGYLEFRTIIWWFASWSITQHYCSHATMISAPHSYLTL